MPNDPERVVQELPFHVARVPFAPPASASAPPVYPNALDLPFAPPLKLCTPFTLSTYRIATVVAAIPIPHSASAARAPLAHAPGRHRAVSSNITTAHAHAHAINNCLTRRSIARRGIIPSARARRRRWMMMFACNREFSCWPTFVVDVDDLGRETRFRDDRYRYPPGGPRPSAREGRRDAHCGRFGWKCAKRLCACGKSVTKRRFAASSWRTRARRRGRGPGW